MTELVVLPGLDGTATLHGEFVAAVGSTFDAVKVVAYPLHETLDYGALEAIARAALPPVAPFVLLGESFSGPIALSIAANPPRNLVGLLLSTTFARSPVPLLSPFATLTRWAPVRAVPGALLSWLLLGRWATPRLESALREALRLVAPDVLRLRAAEAMRVDVTARLGAIAVPALCLHATSDRLLSGIAGRRLAAGIARCSTVDINGPHLLLQTRPAECARAIAGFASGIA